MDLQRKIKFKAVVEILSRHSTSPSYLHKLSYIFYQYKTIRSGPVLALNTNTSKHSWKYVKAKIQKKKRTQLQFIGEWKKGDEKEREDQLSWYGSWHNNLMLLSGNGCSVEECWGASGSLGVVRLDTVFVMWLGDKGIDICWHLLPAAGSKWQMTFSAAGY